MGRKWQENGENGENLSIFVLPIELGC